MPPTIEQVKAAEKKMMAAGAALLDYIERTAATGTDREIHDRLNRELMSANDEYLRLIGQLRPSS